MNASQWDVTAIHPLSGHGWDDMAMFRGGNASAADIAPDPDEVYAQALLREREGYVRRGLADRVAAVDAELNRLAGPPASTKPAARKSRARKVADDDS